MLHDKTRSFENFETLSIKPLFL